MRFLYTLIFITLLPFVVLRLLLRSFREPGYRKHIKERFGLCRKRQNTKQCIWLHAVSVGEQVAASPIIKLLTENHPDHDIQITVTTAAGRTCAERLHPNISISYLPYDIPLFWNIFLKRQQPSICLIMEAELWPNLFRACNKKNIPIRLLNARLSNKSAQRYQHIKNILKQMFVNTCAAAQTEADKINLEKIGIASDKIKVLGNLKESVTINSAQIKAGCALRHKLNLQSNFIWIAASTHPGEEQIILETQRQLLKKIPTAKLLLAPRHLNRCRSIETMLNKSKLSWQKKSDYSAADVMLWNTMGELAAGYALANVACVCGSFAKIGGHNILEPAAIGRAIIIGPEHQKIITHCNLLKKFSALIIANDATDLAEKLYRLATDDRYLEQGANAERAAMTLQQTAQNYYVWLKSSIV